MTAKKNVILFLIRAGYDLERKKIWFFVRDLFHKSPVRNPLVLNKVKFLTERSHELPWKPVGVVHEFRGQHFALRTEFPN